MKKVYITPTIFFDEVLDCGELLQFSKNIVNDLTGGGEEIKKNLSIGNGSTIQGDGGTTSSDNDNFVNSKGGFFEFGWRPELKPAEDIKAFNKTLECPNKFCDIDRKRHV